MQEENWKDIKDYEGYYQVSDIGRVRSVDRKIITKSNNFVSYKGKTLNQTKCSTGYLKVRLYKMGLGKTFKVHTLVLKTFLPLDFKSSLVCDHVDNNRLNNRLDNLQWITNRENCSKDKNRELPTGVSYTGYEKNPYYVRIYINGKQKNLGHYDTIEEASQVYQEALLNYKNKVL